MISLRLRVFRYNQMQAIVLAVHGQSTEVRLRPAAARGSGLRGARLSWVAI